MSEKPTNPKDLVATSKAPLGQIPPVASAWQSVAHIEGNLKYGLANWREAGVKAMVYIDAAKRHLDKFRDGQWADPETLVPHLASVAACCNIIIDAMYADKLIDDRPKSLDPEQIERAYGAVESVVKHLQQMHADKNPVHQFITGPAKLKEDK